MAGVLLVAGCGSSDPGEPAADSGERETYIEQVEARLEEFDREVDALEADLAEATAEVRESLDEELEALEETRREAAEELRQLQSGAEEQWQELRSDLDVVIDELDRAYRRILDRIEA
jgi:chromosome segregation ATPase